MSETSKKIRHLTEDEKSGIKNVFESLDTDKDGFLDYYETKAAMKALGSRLKKDQILTIMRAYDKNHGDKIAFQDFYYIMADKLVKRDPVEEFKYAYKLFTADSNCGKITLIDLQRINENLGTRLTEDEMTAMIEEFDIDRDGCINEDEFIEIMKNSVVE